MDLCLGLLLFGFGGCFLIRAVLFVGTSVCAYNRLCCDCDTLIWLVLVSFMFGCL